MVSAQLDRLAAKDLTVGYQSKTVVSGVNLSIAGGKITALIGANGSGKSTLLRTLARVVEPLHGSVLLDGKAIEETSRRLTAKILALLPQNPIAPDGLTVRELCRFGRHPHRGVLGFGDRDEGGIVEKALAAADLAELADRPLEQLSGGQRQRAWIAMALVQDTPILLLDEPTTYLDIAHQMSVLGLLKDLNKKEGRTIVMVVHDLNHAAQFADEIVAVADQGIYAAGPPAELLTPELVRDVFGLEAVIIRHPSDGTPVCLPLARGQGEV